MFSAFVYKAHVTLVEAVIIKDYGYDFKDKNIYIGRFSQALLWTEYG